jgi:thymidylate kinase
MSVSSRQASSSTLAALIDTLNRSEIPYCILHGYLGYPDEVPSDVDCLVPAELLPSELASFLCDNREALGATLVQWLQHQASAHYFVLARWTRESTPQFIAFDASSDYRARGTTFYRGEEILRERRLYKGFWVPPPAREFGYYLVKKVSKGSLTDGHAQRLSELYSQDPIGCGREIGRFWRRPSAQLLTGAARSGDWRGVVFSLRGLRKELLRPSTLGGLRRAGEYWARDLVRRARRWIQPTGAHVVLLGPDGAGKSTVSAMVSQHLAAAFRRTSRRHLRPGLLQPVLTGPPTPPTAPHSKPPRSLLGSLAKCVFWLFDYTIGYYVTVRPALVRSTLVLFDRYLLDVLVDPIRYRYGGSQWLIRLLWRLAPKPDLVVLLDAPPQILRSRKLETSLEETVRQREAYRALVHSLPNGHLVDAAQPVERVAAQVDEIVLEFLARRTARRLGLKCRPAVVSPGRCRPGRLTL